MLGKIKTKLWKKLSKVRLTDKEAVNGETQDHTLAGYLYDKFLILRILGVLPFSSYLSSDGKHHYCWKWISWATFYSLLLNTSIFSAIFWGSNLLYVPSTQASRFQDGFNLNSSAIEKTAIRLFPLFHSFMSLFYIIIGVISTPSVLQAIEIWSTFEALFAESFFTTRPIFFKMFRQTTISGALGSIFAIATAIPINNQLRQSYCSNENFTGHDNSLSLCEMRTFIPVINIIYAFCEDFKNIVMVRTIAVAFSLIHDDIKEWCEGIHGIRNVTVQEVRKWQKLISVVREQAKSTADFMAAPNIFNLFTLFFVFCLSLFLGILLIRGDLNDVSRNTLNSAVLLTWIGFGRLSVKAMFAERLMSEEKSLANYLRLLDGTDQTDLMTRLEISTIVSVMDKKPTKLDLNGLFVLNYSLLAKILTTVVTYLVVLFQFNDL